LQFVAAQLLDIEYYIAAHLYRFHCSWYIIITLLC